MWITAVLVPFKVHFDDEQEICSSRSDKIQQAQKYYMETSKIVLKA